MRQQRKSLWQQLEVQEQVQEQVRQPLELEQPLVPLARVLQPELVLELR